jgi:N-acyl-D-amino-acid deacylase
VDAAGRYVSPGFIDIMDQSGPVLLVNGLAENKLRMGVTSAIGGEGGTPSWPSWTERARSGALTEDIPRYFEILEEQGISINFGTFYSQAQARRQVVGTESRAPSAASWRRCGITSPGPCATASWGSPRPSSIRPAATPTPTRSWTAPRVAARYGGIYASHIRGEGKELVEAVSEAVEIGERAGIPVEIFHLKAAYEPGWGVLMPEAIRSSRGPGIGGWRWPPTSIPTRRGYRAGGHDPELGARRGTDSLRARLQDPEVRERLRGSWRPARRGGGTSWKRRAAGRTWSW